VVKKRDLFPPKPLRGLELKDRFWDPFWPNPENLLLGTHPIGKFGSLVGPWPLSQNIWVGFYTKRCFCYLYYWWADGPTSIFVASKLAPDLMGAIRFGLFIYGIGTYYSTSYYESLTTPEERKIKMKQLREVSKLEKLLFPLTVLMLSI